MRRIGLLSVLAFACLPSLAFGQHPCDLTPPTVTLAQSSVRTGFCHDLKDVDGNTTTITSVRVVIDGTQAALTWTNPSGIAPTSPTANGLGEWYFESTSFPVASGTHILYVYVSNSAGESAGSPAYSFTLTGAKPKPGKGPRVK